MAVKMRGSFREVQRRADRAAREAMREIGRDAKGQLERHSPRRTGRLSRSWRMEQNGLTVTIGNTQEHAPVVALGRKDRPMSGLEKRNVGFHKRALEKVRKRAGRTIKRVFQRSM